MPTPLATPQPVHPTTGRAMIALSLAAAAIADLRHGNVDVITGANFVSFFKAQGEGVLSVKILAEEATCAPGANEIVVPEGSPITRPADLAGKTIAVNILGDIQTMTTSEGETEAKIGAVPVLDNRTARAFQRTADQMHTAGLLAKPLNVSPLVFGS